MKISLKHSIALRLLRAVFGCYLFVTTIVTCSQLYLEYSHIQKDVMNELFDIADSFDEGLGNVLWNYEYDSMQSIVLGMQKIQVIEGVKITQVEGSIETSAGTFVEDDADIISQSTLTSRGKPVIMMNLSVDKTTKTLYEYKHPILFKAAHEKTPRKLGYAYLYANQNAVIDKVKSSFTLILVNALIKSFALWLIFLFFSRRLITQPLDTLTQATEDVTRGRQGKLSTLEDMAESNNKDELQLLSVSFLSMQDSITDKIENLNALNEFAVILTKVKHCNELYKQVHYLLQRYMSISFCVVFDKDNRACWHSLSGEQEHTFSKAAQEAFHLCHEVISHKAKNTIAYRNHDKPLPADGLSELAYGTPILYLPLTESLDGDEPQAMWLFGTLKPNYLDENNELKQESLNFLEMVANVANGTLTNMKQHRIIEDQKNSLEQRVEERTQALADANKELKYMAVHDPLTHLPNRTLYQDRLENTVSLAAREKSRFAVGCIDLTQFKAINDTYGHDAGDKVLIEVAKRFKSALRESDTLARMGGDEFALILNKVSDHESINIIMQHLAETLEDAIVISDSVSILANANIGIAIFPEHEIDGDLLYKYADVAMYQAKRSGSNYMIFDKTRDTEEKEYLKFLYDLEQGITQEQLRLHYQPIIDLKTNLPVGLEALVRWQHPERGLVLPGEFISHAERTALIEPLTEWVVRTACQQCLVWHSKGFMLTMSINLSRRIFSLPNLAERLESILKEFDLAPKWLKLEITETAAMGNPEQAMIIIDKLKTMGFLLSIDDFGTGQSSLSYLTRLPVQELKIDRSFIFPRTQNNMAVVQTIIDLAQVLSLDVVAEGIEDEVALQMVREKGCDTAQGYHLCRPDDAETIDAWLIETFKQAD